MAIETSGQLLDMNSIDFCSEAMGMTPLEILDILANDELMCTSED